MADEKPSSSTEEFHPNPNPHHDFIATSHGLSRVITSDTHVHLGSMSFERSEFMRAFEGYLNPGSAPRPSRKFGNPVPLGVAGFSMSLFIVSLINSGARDVSNGALAAGLCIVYSGLIELIAGIWCIVAENTWAATLITSFSGFWISYGFILIDAFGMVSAYKDTPDQLQSVLGFYLVGWTIFSGIMWSFTFRSTWILFSLMLFVVIVLCLLSAGQFLLLSHPTTATNCTKAGGVIGVFTAFIGWYIVYEGIATNENTFFVPPVLLMPQTVLGRKKKTQVDDEV